MVMTLRLGLLWYYSFFLLLSLAHERLRYALEKTQQILQHNQYS